MTLNNLFNTLLFSQKLTIVDDCDPEVIIIDKQKYGEIPYVAIAGLLDCEVLMVTSKYEDDEAILYIVVTIPQE